MGEYQHTLDEKGRLTMPARFREELGERFVVTRGLDGCLFVYPMPEWANLEAKLQALPLTHREARAFVRLLLSGATECELDRQGRFALPSALREHAGLDKEAVVIGVGSRLEIWSKARWSEYAAEAAGDFAQIAEKIVDLGL